jgi:hypothetical protein
MKFLFAILLLLTACAAQPKSVLTPVTVDMPVSVFCAKTNIAMPTDKISPLSNKASLTEFTKACAEQTLLDRAYIMQLQAVLDSCSEPDTH